MNGENAYAYASAHRSSFSNQFDAVYNYACIIHLCHRKRIGKGQAFVFIYIICLVHNIWDYLAVVANILG
jgi:hypothetical protein